MHSKPFPSIAPLLGLLLLPGCTFISLVPDAEAVRVVDEAAAAGCQEVGTTRVEVLDKVGFLSRNPQQVSDELDTLARNAGSDLQGNAVVPSGPVASGKRAYRILRCP
jgi:hypothetical protein